jgi:hypothetical protein
VFELQWIDALEIVMVLSIVGLLFAIHKVEQGNQALHERNLREREEDKLLFPESEGSNADQQDRERVP